MMPAFLQSQFPALLFLAWLCFGCSSGSERPLVLYTSQDRIYVEPILQEFSRNSKTTVDVVYDSEAVKTVGLVNRLIAERNNPQCDLFWSNESFRTRQMARLGILKEFDRASTLVLRKRCLVINTNLLNIDKAPRTLQELVDSRWAGKIAIAYPLFGTTGSHLLKLRESLGEPAWSDWCRSLLRNKPLVLDGNSLVARMVARGEVWIGLTDSDDVRAEQKSGAPVVAVEISDFPMPVTASLGMIQRSPAGAGVERLAEYLSSEAVSRQLVASGAFDEVVKRGDDRFQSLSNPFSESLLNQAEAATESLRKWFLR